MKVLKLTVVGDRRLNNLSGSHLPANVYVYAYAYSATTSAHN